MGFFDDLGDALKGSITGLVGGNPLGAVLGTGLDLFAADKKQENEIDNLQGLGLTPQEIAGAGTGGGSGTGAATQVLGNQQNVKEQQKRQQGFEERQRQLDRETDLMKSQIQANATLQSANTSAQATLGSAELSSQANRYATDTQRRSFLDRLVLDTRVSNAQIEQTKEQTKTVIQDRGFQAVLHSERWARLFSGMSAENVAASAIAVVNGVDIESVLKGTDATPGQKETLSKFLQEVRAHSSNMQRETDGSLALVRRGAEANRDMREILTEAFQSMFK